MGEITLGGLIAAITCGLLLHYWWVLALIGAGSVGVGAYLHNRGKKQQEEQKGFVLVTAGTIGCLTVCFYIFGIISSIISIIVGLFRLFS